MSLVRLVAAGDTHIGMREHNEDAILLRRELNLFALADGAGGENAGNVASSLALTTLGHQFEETEGDKETGFDVLGLPVGAKRLSAAVHKANAEVVQLANANDKYMGMGTTVVAAHIEPDIAVLHLAHVGDSRCYRLRDGIVELLTQDHSLMNDVLELAPQLDETKARSLPTRVVTRALGMSKNVRVAIQSHALVPGDRYLLCSDGLTDQLDEEQIADALRQDARPDALVKLMLDVAQATRARDNIAIVVVEVHPTAVVDWPSPTLRARPLQQQIQREARADVSEPEIIIVDRGSGHDGDEHDHDEGTEEENQDDDPTALDLEELEDEVRDLEEVPTSVRLLELPDDDASPTSEFPAVHIIPEASSPEAAEAIKKVMLQDLPEPRDERDATIRFRRKCKHCDAQFDGPADVCPFCWKAV